MSLPIQGEQILKLIPQRQPMIMVDAVLSYSDMEVVAALTIIENNIFLENDILQESGLLEHMAQTVATHTGYSFFIRNESAPTGYIGAIQQAEILQLPILGDYIESKAVVVQEFMGVTLVDITTFLRGAIIATAKMKTVIASA